MPADSVAQYQAAPRLTTAVSAPRWFDQAIKNPGESGFFLFEETPIHYLSWTDSKDKPALLFVHGFRGHARWWDFIAPYFTKHYQVFAIDLSGMGDSGHRKNYTYDVHSLEINALIEHLGLSSVTVVAHSFGGSRVIRSAALKPDLFSKVIMVDVHLFFEGDTLPADPVPQGTRRVYPDLETGVSRFRLAPEQPLKEPYIMDYIGRNSLIEADDGWTWKFDPYMESKPFIVLDGDELLRQVVCPIDFIYGDSSAIVDARMAERVLGHAKNPGKTIEIPGTYHHIMICHPEAMISTLLALL